ncbi:alpha-ribazole phosphatase [Clostridiaceae bacterium 35-E11]
MKERKIYLLRHGQPKLESDKKYYMGRLDLDLSNQGIEQAAGLARKFKEMPLGNIFCSNMKRTEKTAQVIGKYHDIKPQKIKDLCEINLGDWEGRTFEEVRQRYPEEFKKRGEDIINYCTPNGESFFDVNKRVMKAFYDILSNTDKNLLIVGHAGVNKLILCNIRNIPIEDMFKIRQNYACINIIHQRDKEFEIKLLNGKYNERGNLKCYNSKHGLHVH